MTYPELLIRAVECAAEWHEGQTRKHPTRRIPYIVHPMSVAILLLREGCDDETIAAGLLHDVIEDCGVTTDELAKNMTPRIAELVSWVTEPPKSDPWAARKKAYRDRLVTAPREALLVAAADHVCNLRSLADAARVGSDVWSLFRSDRAARIAHEHAVLDILKERLDSPLVEELESALSDVEGPSAPRV